MLNKRELARELGVSVASVSLYVQRGMPCDKPGNGVANRFDLESCREWLKNNVKTNKARVVNTPDTPDNEVDTPPSDGVEDLESGKLAKLKIETDILKVKLDAIKGKYLRKVFVKHDLALLVADFRAALAGVADEVTTDPNLAAQITASIDTRLSALAHACDRLPGKIAKKQLSSFVDRQDKQPTTTDRGAE